MYNLLVCLSVLVCAPLCLAKDFDSQLRDILNTYMLSNQDRADVLTRVLHDMKSTLNQRWQGYEVIPCGSLVTGLATKSSDVDLYIKLPNFNASAGLHVLKEVHKLFEKQPDLYSELKYRHNNGHISSFFSFFNIPTQQTVDTEFHTGDLSVTNSKLVKYYFNIDKRFRPLGGFLKFWFQTHGLTGHKPGSLPNYALYMLIIFYLQQQNLAPPGYMLQINSRRHFVDNWDVSFNEIPYSTDNSDNLYELVGGFFKHYGEFNFKRYMVAPFTGRPISKNAFKDIKTFPKAYSLYDKDLKNTLQCRIKENLKVTTDICSQDVFMHDSNTAERLSHENAMKFKHLMKSVATIFDCMPCDRVIEAILVIDRPTESNNTEEINKEDCTEETET